ncbi:glycosyltransferase [Propionivibrio dicarboxylicus]|uniref:Glycosyltransferase involved in cell wall bisynthesis n=1 Tax=Propionivibrio dicarboxylicus TaxID=83767 RepID=A0A1G8L0E2_9RHOO|nr:glycosyltransferase [Propionivibrio dicarboxylicus]SDI49103.1 Glycosyltransferase involved in cell wall bisynthesis [Propionivibrio dicarboxylicus]
MKFGLITTNLRGGGAEKAMLKLSALLAGRGHETHLIILEHRVEHALPAAVTFTALTEPGHPVRKGWLGKHLLAWRLRRHVKKLAGDTPFDLIVSTLPFADEVCKQARLPKLWHRIANTLSAEIGRLSATPAKAARRLKKYRELYDAGQLLAVSRGVAEDLHELNIAARRIECLYNPFDASAIRTAAKAPAPLPDSPYIVHVGRFSAQKRHDLLLEAFRQLPSSHRLVLLCHDDPALQALIGQHDLSDRVIVAGFQPNPYPWIAAADLLVLCSDHEGMPNVLVEALLLGVPVVSTDCPSGPREVLQNGKCGRLVPCNDAAALNEAMRETLSGKSTLEPFDPSLFLPSAAISHLERLAQETL